MTFECRTSGAGVAINVNELTLDSSSASFKPPYPINTQFMGLPLILDTSSTHSFKQVCFVLLGLYLSPFSQNWLLLDIQGFAQSKPPRCLLWSFCPGCLLHTLPSRDFLMIPIWVSTAFTISCNIQPKFSFT